MDAQITNAELARRLDDRFGLLRDDLHEINTKIEKLVPREVYDAQRQAAIERTTALEQRIAALETRSRWLIGSIIIPIVIVVINALLSAKGVKP